MNYLTIAFLLVIVVIVGIVAMTARIALSENSKVLNRIRDALQRVRLFKMLQKRNVDVQSYLRDTDVSKIRQQIAVCDSCPSVQSCETALESKDTVVNDFSFCPNDPAIEQLQSSAAPEQGKLSDPPGRSA